MGNGEIGMEKQLLGFDRVDVLALLWKNAQWLDGRISKKQLKVNDAHRQRVFMIQTLNQACKTLLYGLKDEELELRIAELEEKFKGAVIIPEVEQ